MKAFLNVYLTERVKMIITAAPAAIAVIVPSVLRIIKLFVNA